MSFPYYQKMNPKYQLYYPSKLSVVLSVLLCMYYRYSSFSLYDVVIANKIVITKTLIHNKIICTKFQFSTTNPAQISFTTKFKDEDHDNCRLFRFFAQIVIDSTLSVCWFFPEHSLLTFSIGNVFQMKIVLVISKNFIKKQKKREGNI